MRTCFSIRVFDRKTLRPQLRQYRAVAPVLRILLLAILSGSSSPAPAEPSIHILKGANQQTVYSSPFPLPLVVWVTDPVAQQPMAGVKILFSAGPCIGLSATHAITDEHGLAAVNATGLAPCASSVTAQIDGLPVEGFPVAKVQFDNMTVSKAILTVVPADLAGDVGGRLPPIAEYSIQGFVNGDTEATAKITGAPVLSTTAEDNGPRANYAIKAGVGTLASPNYDFVAGFGTFAVVGEPVMNPSTAGDATAGLGLHTQSAEVRPALTNKPSAVSLLEPAFLAGLHGQSGVFVQSAIWQVKTTFPAPSQPSAVRNAIALKGSLAAASTAAPPVRLAVEPKTESAAAPSAPAPVRPAVAPITANSAPHLSASLPGAVRSVALVNPSASKVPAASPYSASAIRKAFNPPGAKAF